MDFMGELLREEVKEGDETARPRRGEKPWSRKRRKREGVGST
jgi:hypothetical protein